MDNTRINKLSASIQGELELLYNSLFRQGFDLNKYSSEIKIDSDGVDKLSSYLILLEKWNKSHDLVGPGTSESYIVPHIIDSLASLIVLRCNGVIPDVLKNNQEVNTKSIFVDIGSGAGLPGIVWSIFYGLSFSFILIEPRAKRINFLKECIRVLELTNTEAIENRANFLPNVLSKVTFDKAFITLRAIKPDKSVLGGLELLNNCRFIWLTGPNTAPDHSTWRELEWREEAFYSLGMNGELGRRVYIL
ncbi:MAG TPA: class I SAM-dependent methyltransferase [Oligoflexia bacterium]|nr:class I SAM-dependent methyltransferase [Oligoflexia bacterium]HMP49876.1 class I SAM-dependent methyltransferase [Oligoflexia bacterium]